MAVPDERDLKPLGPYPRGANNIANETSIPRGACRSAKDVDFYPGGRWRRRQGSALETAINGGANSGWSTSYGYSLLRAGTSLLRFIPGLAPITLFTGLDPENAMVYCEVNQYIFVSDNVRSLRVDPMTDTVRSWGLDEPHGQPVLAVSANGGLDEGNYQVTFTFVDAAKEESGAMTAATIFVPAGGGIDISQVPQPNDNAVTGIRVYITAPNDKILKRIAVLPVGTLTYHVNRLPLGAKLRSQFLSAIPGVSGAGFSGGRLWFIIGNLLGYSDALYFGLWNPANNYIAYPALLSMIAPATMQQASVASAGLFVSTFLQENNDPPSGGTYFLSGTTPDDYRNVSAYRAGAVPGALVYVNGAYFEDQNIPGDVVPVWVATNGTVCVGLPTGVVRGITEGRFAMAVGTRGSAAFRELNGIRQILFSMEGANELPIVANDSVAIERSRNGIVQL